MSHILATFKRERAQLEPEYYALVNWAPSYVDLCDLDGDEIDQLIATYVEERKENDYRNGFVGAALPLGPQNGMLSIDTSVVPLTVTDRACVLPSELQMMEPSELTTPKLFEYEYEFSNRDLKWRENELLEHMRLYVSALKVSDFGSVSDRDKTCRTTISECGGDDTESESREEESEPKSVQEPEAEQESEVEPEVAPEPEPELSASLKNVDKIRRELEEETDDEMLSPQLSEHDYCHTNKD